MITWYESLHVSFICTHLYSIDDFYHKCTHSSQYPKITCSCATWGRHKHGLQPSGDRKWDFLNLSFACLVSKFVLCERLNNIAAANLGLCHLLCHLVANWWLFVGRYMVILGWQYSCFLCDIDICTTTSKMRMETFASINNIIETYLYISVWTLILLWQIQIFWLVNNHIYVATNGFTHLNFLWFDFFNFIIGVSV